MNIVRRDSMRDVDEFFARFAPAALVRWPRLVGEESARHMEWAPAADVTETEREYLVKAELPGIKREDVKVTVEDSVLTIQGERSFEKAEEGEKQHRVERSYGSFYRSFSLPDNVAVGDIQAESRDGLLLLHLPKVKIQKPKVVQIKVE
jgi:HSP20 family protein